MSFIPHQTSYDEDGRPPTKADAEWRMTNCISKPISKPTSIFIWISSSTQIDLFALYLSRRAFIGSMFLNRCAHDGLRSSSVFRKAFLLASCHIFLTFNFGSFAWSIRIWSNWAYKKDSLCKLNADTFSTENLFLGEPSHKRYSHGIYDLWYSHFLKPLSSTDYYKCKKYVKYWVHSTSLKLTGARTSR